MANERNSNGVASPGASGTGCPEVVMPEILPVGWNQVQAPAPCVVIRREYAFAAGGVIVGILLALWAYQAMNGKK